MNTTELINKINYSPKIVEEIMNFYEGRHRIKTSFQKFCNKHYIDVSPSILFEFFDSISIKIAVMPTIDNEYWSCKIFTSNGIVIMNDFNSRKEAILGGLDKAFYIYTNGFEI